MTSLMTSPGHKIGKILKLIYLRQYLNYSVDQKLKMSEMLMAISLVYSPSGITSGKKSLSISKWRPFWKIWNIKHSFNLTSDIKDRPKLCQKVFWWWRHRWLHRVASIYSCLGEVGSGSKLQGQCMVNGNSIIVFLGYTCQKTISMNNTFRDCRSKVNIIGLLGDLGTNKQHCKLSQIQLFLRLWRHR